MGSSEWDSETRPAPGAGWRRVLPIVLILAGVVVAGLLLSSDLPGESGAILDVETDVSETPPPAPDERAATAPGEEDVAIEPPQLSASPTAGADSAETGGEWVRMAPQPIETGWGHAAAWTGAELIIWGGAAQSAESARLSLLPGGAAYDPARDSWNAIAESPLEARQDAAAAWTGQELLIWGGTGEAAHLADGAGYDPETDVWRALAPSPLTPRGGAAAVWTGSELLVVGGHDNAGGLGDAAAYDPQRDAWRMLSDPPAEIERMWVMDGVWAGDVAVLWAIDGGAEDALRYSVTDDSWQRLPESGSSAGYVREAAWTGDALIVLMSSYEDSQMVLGEVMSGSGELRPFPDGPQVDAWGAAAVWTDAGLLILTNGSRHWLYEPGAQVWSRLPPGPGFEVWEQNAVWTGSEVLIWGQSLAGARRVNTLFRFAPADGAVEGSYGDSRSPERQGEGAVVF